MGEEELEGRVRVEEREVGRQRGWRMVAYRTVSWSWAAGLAGGPVR